MLNFTIETNNSKLIRIQQIYRCFYSLTRCLLQSKIFFAEAALTGNSMF